MMAVHAQAPPPSQGPPKVQSRPASLWRTLLPLVLLIIPLGINIAAHYAPEGWQYWLVLAAGLMAAGIVIWVLVRLFFYSRERWIQRRQQTFLRRQDPYFVTANKLDVRIRQVHERLKSAGFGPYGLKWFLTMGGDPKEVEALLQGSGLTFPPGLDKGLNISDDQLDRWRLANEAIFIDTSASPLEADDRGWEVLAARLAAHRRRETISGVILILDVDQFSDTGPESIERRRESILKRLRSLQSALSLTFPVYLVVSGINRIAGFQEFYAGLPPDKRSQMMGWSAPIEPGREFDQNVFRQGLAELSSALDSMMLSRLSGAMQPESADRVYAFNEELKGLLTRIREDVEAVFAPNLYLDPLPLRGFYLTGGLDEGPMVSFRPEGPLLAASAAPSGGDYFSGGEGRSWFTRDLFKKKILPEAGMVSRPRNVQQRELIIKAVTAFSAALGLFLGGWWVAQTVNDARTIVRNLEPTLKTAQVTLKGEQTPDRPLQLCNSILQNKKVILGVALWERVVRTGRYSELEEKLGRIHRACFQDLFLRGYIDKVEDALRYWTGEGDFKLFAKALAEYIRWSRPESPGGSDLSIAPFAYFVGTRQGSPEDVIRQFKAFSAEGGAAMRLVGADSQQIISRALREMDKYLNPSVSMSAGPNAWQEQSQWWMGFTKRLAKIQRLYHALAITPPEAQDAPYQEALAYYDSMVDRLAAFLNEVDKLGEEVGSAYSQGAGWVNAERLVEGLKTAARGWHPVNSWVENLNSSASLYRRNVEGNLQENLYLIQLLGDQPGYPWLGEQVSLALPKQGKIITDPLFQVGGPLLSLFAALGEYHSAIEQWQAGYSTWERQISGSQRIGKQAEMLNLEERHMIQARNRVLQIRQEISGLAGKGQKPNKPTQPTLKGLVSKVTGKGGQAQGKQQSADSMRGEILGLFQWPKINKSVPAWLKVMERVRLYQTALYWQELEAKFSFGDNLLQSQSWQGLKADPLYATGDANSLIYPINEFLEQWMQAVPHEFLAYSGATGKNPAPRELTGFLRLNSAVMQFQQKWMQPLRKAAQQFVTCIHDMDKDPARAWAQIWNTQGPGASGRNTVSWGALSALSSFRNSFEAANGPALENITGTLVDMESTAVNSFQQAVISGFNAKWGALIANYEKLGFNNVFPFKAHTKDEAPQGALTSFFSDLESLASSYALIHPSSNKAPSAQVSLDPMAGRMIGRLHQSGRLQFIKGCMSFQQFLAGKGFTKPLQVQISLVPGEIGRHMHWLRVQVGDKDHYDLNVYGKPAVTIPLRASSGTVSFQALDVNRNPTSMVVAAKGSMGLLQLPYALGRPRDPKRQNWLIDSAVPSVAQPGRMITFQMRMDFNASLPELPKWPTN